MIENKSIRCKDFSDRDFIYDIFSNKGFATNASSFLNPRNQSETILSDQDIEEQLDINEVNKK